MNEKRNGGETLELAKRIFEAENFLATSAKHIDAVHRELVELMKQRTIVRARREELVRLLTEAYQNLANEDEKQDTFEEVSALVAGDASVLYQTLPPISLEASKPEKVPFKSRDDVKGLAKIVLDVLDADPLREWKSYDLITAVLDRLDDKDIQRNTVSSAIYRLSKSRLVLKVGNGLLKSAKPMSDNAPMSGDSAQGGGG